MEFRPRRSGKAKYGGFNVGSNNKGGRRWSPAVAARLANDDLSDIAPRKSRSASRKSGASAQELTGWKFRGMLRSVLGTPTRRAAPRSHGATLMLQRAQRKAAEDARARAERKDGEQHEPRQVPTLASVRFFVAPHVALPRSWFDGVSVPLLSVPCHGCSALLLCDLDLRRLCGRPHGVTLPPCTPTRGHHGVRRRRARRVLRRVPQPLWCKPSRRCRARPVGRRLLLERACATHRGRCPRRSGLGG